MSYRVFYLSIGFWLLALSGVNGVTVQTAHAFFISEIMYDLSGVDQDREWIEVYNDTQGPLVVATGTKGFRFYDGSNHLLTGPVQGSAEIPPSGFAIFASDAEVFLVEHAGFSGTVFDTVISLANTIDTLRVIDAEGVLLDEVTYDAAWGARGNGRTLERRVDGTWGESAADGGTPGMENDPLLPEEGNGEAGVSPSPSPTPTPTPMQTPIPTSTPTPPPTPTPSTVPSPSPQANSGPTASPVSSPIEGPSANPAPTPMPLPRIFINEFYPNTAESDAEEEFIEVWNAELFAVNLSSWFVDDTDGGSPPYHVPEGTVIAADSHAVFWRATTGLALNNDADVVRLVTPGGQLYASVAYQNPPKGASSNRTSGGAYVWSTIPTPGTVNIPSPNNSPSNTPTSQPIGLTQTEATKKKEEAGGSGAGEPSIVPQSATTAYAASSRTLSRASVSPLSIDRDTASFPASSASAWRYTAQAIKTIPKKSFFSRNAFWLVLTLAAVGAIVIIRWRRRRVEVS